MTTVAVIFGGRSVEHEVSLRSARTVRSALLAAGHRVVPVGIAPDGSLLDVATSSAALAGDARRLTGGRRIGPSVRALLELEVDVAFPIIHGTYGEDGRLQGALEMLGLPYVGCGVEASAIAFDKVATKLLAAAAGVPVVEGVVVTRGEMRRDPVAALVDAGKLPLPLFVKPAAGGSSVGVRRVALAEELAAAVDFALGFDAKALVERGVAGREIECAVLGGDPPAVAEALGEIVPGAEFYDYADKYLTDAAQLRAPADLDPTTAAVIRTLARRAFQAIGGEGFARIDFFLTEKGPILNEINTLPGFTSISMFPRLWELSGLPLPDLVTRLVDLAFERQASRAAEDQALAAFLASLG